MTLLCDIEFVLRKNTNLYWFCYILAISEKHRFKKSALRGKFVIAFSTLLVAPPGQQIQFCICFVVFFCDLRKKHRSKKSALRGTFVIASYRCLLAQPGNKYNFVLVLLYFLRFPEKSIVQKNRPCGAPCGAGWFFIL